MTFTDYKPTTFAALKNDKKVRLTLEDGRVVTVRISAFDGRGYNMNHLDFFRGVLGYLMDGNGAPFVALRNDISTRVAVVAIEAN